MAMSDHLAYYHGMCDVMCLCFRRKRDSLVVADILRAHPGSERGACTCICICICRAHSAVPFVAPPGPSAGACISLRIHAETVGTK